MRKITEIIKEKDFTFSVELVPPRNGISPANLYDRIKNLKGKIDFVSVTKGAGGSLRGGSFPISYFCQTRFGINAVAHFVCRERTKYQIENELIDLHYFGIKNILALRGDPPAGSSEPWKGEYKYAYMLTQQIKNMNDGKYLPVGVESSGFRKGIKTDFCILVAGHPEDPIEEEIEHMRSKIDAGGEIIITQMVFTFEDYRTYVEKLREAGIRVPVIAGIRPLVSLRQVDSCERFFKINIPDRLKTGLKGRDKEAREFGVNYTVEMIRRLKEYGAAGAHLFVLNDVDLAHEILERL